jgi:Ser/Thr protein kinase RdoA (MazF antagonist)
MRGTWVLGAVGACSNVVTIPRPVIEAFGLEDAQLTPITVGLINQTFRVERGGLPIAVLQRLHPIFDAQVNEDLDVLSAEIERRGLTTPRLIRTRDGARFVVEEGVYRALTFVEGRTLTEVSSPAIAEAAGLLAGRFTRALEGVEHSFRFTRVGVHDTQKHLMGLEAALASDGASEGIDEVRPLAEAILAHARSLPPLPETRRRIVHGDLKITNLLFERDADVGRAVVDLDTLAHGTLPVELGDALRSWCNPAGESRDGGIDVTLFAAALRGFAASGITIDAEERDAIALGVETITTELASRFARDAIEDRYFGWDNTKYPSRRAHCRARAQSQLTLARSVRAARAELEAIARSVF